MRKLLMSLATMLFMAGLVIAAEVTIVKYDKDKETVTVKDDKDKESTYTISKDVKVTIIGKDGDKEGKRDAFLKRLENIDKSKNKTIDITVKDKEITAVKYKGGGRGKN